MDNLLEFWEKPTPETGYLLAGWRQWADAGASSSLLPQYIIDQTKARKIGEIKADPFYLYQLPGAHHLLRPEIKMEDGHRVELRTKKNEIFYTGNERQGLFILLGDEPHMAIDRYAQAFFGIAQEFKLKKVAAVGGVYGPVPYDKDREISCSYSLPGMKADLSKYAVRFSNYEGGASIGTYLTDQAEKLGIEYFAFYAFVPMYDFSQISPSIQGMTVEQDYKAWYDLMRRFNYMFNLGFDLSPLQQQSRELVQSIGAKIEELQKKLPQVNIHEHLEQLTADFVEMSFMPLDDVWEKGLEDIFKDDEA